MAKIQIRLNFSRAHYIVIDAKRNFWVLWWGFYQYGYILAGGDSGDLVFVLGVTAELGGWRRHPSTKGLRFNGGFSRGIVTRIVAASMDRLSPGPESDGL